MRKYLVLVALLAAVLLLYALLPRLSQPLTEDQARAAVMQDLSALNTESRIIQSGKSGETWEFDVLVTQNPHSSCPVVERRFYKLPPVSFRPETFITDCYERNKLLFREEVLINSAKQLGITDGFGCAFRADAVWAEEQAYCPSLDAGALSSFASGLPLESWVAYWETDGNVTLIALDESGAVLKTG
ncbi:MAG: hypothetical protein V1717_01365 [Candidatus Micrarchaeota archaeon]